MPLARKKLLIIGGSSGIGKATAIAAVESGAHVIIAGRAKDRLEEAKAEIGGEIDLCVLDVRDPREMDFCFEKMGGFDHLVITAAEEYDAPFIECELDAARKVFDTKFWGQFAAVQLSVPFIDKRGSITLFSGVPGGTVVRGQSVAAAANCAVESLVRSLSVELSPVRVNAVAPGELRREDEEEEEEAVAESKAIADSLPVRRIGEHRDIAEAVLFLIENQYVTGTVLRVDGGRTVASN